MLFDIHSESKISFKRLTDADLKRSPTSHQTHIGLSNDSLTFMPDDKTEYTGMLIYDSYCDIVHCEIGRITREYGKKDAPNVKSGGVDQDNNVVKNIRDFAAKKPNKAFYLLWFGLDSGTPLFWLICRESTDFNMLDKYCHFDTIADKRIRTLDKSDSMFAPILQYARERLEFVTINLQKDLEITAETETDNPKFKDEDIKKAKSYIQELGRKGEEMVNEFLQREKHEHRVSAFEWVNQSSEKGRPYDFYIKYSSGQEQWMDVKTTDHEFDQMVIVSKNEINFITEKKDPEYAIFRVYSKQDTSAKLKICSHCLRYISKLQRDINYMTASMSDYRANIVNYKIAFEPGTQCFGSISQEFVLN